MFLRTIAILSLVLTAGCSHRRGAASTNPELLTPALAAKALEPGALYFNAPAAPFVPADRPERARAAAFAQAAQDPQLFRKLDRESRFAVLWLCGDPSQFKPLLEHLLSTQDFSLAYLDHTSLVFRRGSAAWDPARLEEIRARASRCPPSRPASSRNPPPACSPSASPTPRESAELAVHLIAHGDRKSVV